MPFSPWLSAVVVLLWLFAALIQVGRSSLAAALGEEPEQLARVRPVAAGAVPEPPPPLEPEKREEREEAPAPRRVGEGELAVGAALLDAPGDFPALSFSYEAFPSFGAYAQAMRRLGARFVAVRNRDILGEVDLATGAVAPPALGASFSPRARDYGDETGLVPAARAVRERFGPRAVVMMLVPRSMDAGLFGGVARVLEERGEAREGLREIQGRYERSPGGGVHLRLEAALRRDGSRVALDSVFDLGQIRGAGRG